MATVAGVQRLLQQLVEKRKQEAAARSVEGTALERETRLVQMLACARRGGPFSDPKDERRCRRVLTLFNAAQARRSAALYGDLA